MQNTTIATPPSNNNMENTAEATRMMIDVHTHLYDDKFFPNNFLQIDNNFTEIEQILEKSLQVSVHKMIVVSEEEETAIKVLNLCKKYPNRLYAGIGLHPCCIKKEFHQQVNKISELILENQEFICCIGEVGLDFTPGVLKSIKERICAENVEQVKSLQRQALEQFVELSNRTGLPLNVHSRSAGRPTIQLLAEKGARNVLMHCFDGSAKVVREGLGHGYYFSIPSNVIRSKQLQELVGVVPMDRILLETDSPALVPNLPKREDFESEEMFELAIKNSRNDPSNIPLSAQMISQIKKCSLEEVISKTLLNTLKLFPKLK